MIQREERDRQNIMDKETFALLCHSLLGLILIPHKEFGVVPVEGGQAEREELFVTSVMISRNQDGI